MHERNKVVPAFMIKENLMGSVPACVHCRSGCMDVSQCVNAR
jgi:hypothetical protein